MSFSAVRSGVRTGSAILKNASVAGVSVVASRSTSTSTSQLEATSEKASIPLGSPTVGVYEAPKETDLRSPCPALNTLANHGYLPRDGRAVAPHTIAHQVSRVYNLSLPLAALIAYGTVILLRWNKPWTWLSPFNLQDIAANHGVEHPASLAHDNTPHDARFGATRVCPVLSKRLIEQARGGGYSADDFAQIRVQRQCDPGSKLEGWRAEIARGECSLTMNVFAPTPKPGEEERVPEDVIRTWWIGERLPDGFKPARQTTLMRAASVATKIRNRMAELEKANAIKQQ